jgi:hypothetical protein
MRKRESTPSQRRRRSWFIPKVLLLLACVALLLFIGVILLMERELRRVGLFGEDSAPASTSPLLLSPHVGKDVPRQGSSPSAVAEELTPNDKQQLDRILRSR